MAELQNFLHAYQQLEIKYAEENNKFDWFAQKSKLFQPLFAMVNHL